MSATLKRLVCAPFWWWQGRCLVCGGWPCYEGGLPIECSDCGRRVGP